MQKEAVIEPSVVSYLGTTCIFTITDVISIGAQSTEDRSCCAFGRRNPCFTCPREQVVGAEVATNSGFRIHYAKFVEYQTKKSKCHLHKTGIIDCGARALSMIIRTIRSWSCPVQETEKIPKIFLLVNPKSGKGRAIKILNNRIQPMIRNIFGWSCETRATMERGAAKKIMQEANLSSCTIIGILGGDGTFHEALQGVLRRIDWRRILQIPFVPIPAGSGNALATSLQLYDVDTTLFSIFKRRFQKLDIISVTQKDEKLFSFLGVMYGALSSIDIGTECLRCMGQARFTIGAIKEIVKMPTFDAKFAYLPYLEVGTSNQDTTQKISSPCLSMFGSVEAKISSDVRQWFHETNVEGSRGPDGWIMAPSFSTRFLAVLNLPYISQTSNFVPHATLNDGVLHLIHVPFNPADNRRKMMDVFIKSENGKHLDIQGVHTEKIMAFLFLPGNKSTWVTVDGEVVPSDVLLSMELMPQFMNVVTSGISKTHSK